MRHPTKSSSSRHAVRLAAVVSLGALVAGCSADTQRFGPAPWSTAQAQHQMSQQPRPNPQGWTPGEVTGSLPQQPSWTPPAPQAPTVQSQPLPPVNWTPPPAAAPPMSAPPMATPPAVMPAPAPIPQRPVAAPRAAEAPVPRPPASPPGWQRGPEPARSASTFDRPAEPAATPRTRQPQTASRPASHTVAQGESVASIARRYGIEPNALAAANQLGPSDRIRVGQTLRLPRPGETVQATRRTPDPTPTASTERPQREERRTARAVEQEAAPERPRREERAQRQPEPRQQEEREEAEAPAPQRPQRQQQAERPAAPAPAAPAAPTPAPQRQAETPRAATPAPQRQAALPEPEARTSTEFRWPVRGRVVTRFGRQGGGGNSDGIAIAVPTGTPVKAAENGVVAYAGSELRGYGNLVLIRHEGDWVTAYAHNAEILVRRGEQVRRGQTIARSGQTGNVSQPQLHFEIRRGSSPVDPMQHLTGG